LISPWCLSPAWLFSFPELPGSVSAADEISHLTPVFIRFFTHSSTHLLVHAPRITQYAIRATRYTSRITIVLLGVLCILQWLWFVVRVYRGLPIKS